MAAYQHVYQSNDQNLSVLSVVETFWFGERQGGGAQNLKICNQNKHQNLLFKKEIKIGEAQNLELFIFPPCPLVNAHRNKFLQTTSPERNAAVGIVHLFLPKKQKKVK